MRGAVRGMAGHEAVTLDHALEPTPLRDTLHVDVATLLEQRDGQRLADLEPVERLHAELAQELHRRQVARLELAQCGTRHPSLLRAAVAELDGLVAVALHGAHLGDRAGPRLDHGHGNPLALLVEELGHPHLLTDQSDHWRVTPSY